MRAESCVPLVCDPPELAASGHCPHTCREQPMLPAWGRAECQPTPPSGRRLGVLGKITPMFPFLEGPEDLKHKGTSRHLEFPPRWRRPSFRGLLGRHLRRRRRPQRLALRPPPLARFASHTSHELAGHWTKRTSKCLSDLYSGQNRTASVRFSLWASVAVPDRTGKAHARSDRHLSPAMRSSVHCGCHCLRLFTPGHQNQTQIFHSYDPFLHVGT